MGRTRKASLETLRTAALELEACRRALHNERMREASGEQIPLSHYAPHATTLSRLCADNMGLMEMIGVTPGDLQLFLIGAGKDIVKRARARSDPKFTPGSEMYYISLVQFMEEHRMPKELIRVDQFELDAWRERAEDQGITAPAEREGKIIE